MSKKTKKIILFVLPVLFIAIFVPVYAAVSQEGWNPDNYASTGLPDRKVSEILLTFIQWAIIIVGLLGVIIFIYGGFLYLTAQGETEKLETAKKVIIYAIVGIVVAVLGYVAVKTINDLLVGNVGAGTPTGAPAVPGTQTAPAYSMDPAAAPPPGSTPGNPNPGGQMPVAPGMTGP